MLERTNDQSPVRGCHVPGDQPRSLRRNPSKTKSWEKRRAFESVENSEDRSLLGVRHETGIKTMDVRRIGLAVVLSALVAGCGTFDGPGTSRDRDAGRGIPLEIPGAIPGEISRMVDPDGRIKVGNPYQVFGVTYYPQDRLDYDATGVASWYGPGFHGKRTANGEIYDQQAMTAAHPTLAMPSVVRVTNLETGVSVVVKINDRGPFAKGREIDMSSAAAEALGFRRAGTARVRVQVLQSETLALRSLYEDQEAASSYASLSGRPVSFAAEASNASSGVGSILAPAIVTHRATDAVRVDGKSADTVEMSPALKSDAAHARQNMQRIEGWNDMPIWATRIGRRISGGVTRILGAGASAADLEGRSSRSTGGE